MQRAVTLTSLLSTVENLPETGPDVVPVSPAAG